MLEIERTNFALDKYVKEDNFIGNYDEHQEYRLKPKETKSELDLFKEKYEKGNYICIWRNPNPQGTQTCKWHIFGHKFNTFEEHLDYRLIHNKHKDILDAWLANNSVEIEVYFNTRYILCDGWIDGYSENCAYRLKQQYPIFKRNENGEVFKITNDKLYSIVLSKNSENIGEVIYYCNSLLNSYETIPFDEKRGLYHLQPVWRYNNQNEVTIDFYSKEVSALLRTEAYKKVEPITPEQLKVMPFVWKMYQQVLKDKQ